MKLNELKSKPGATHYRKRVGRGIASGKGKTAGRGHKGAKARAGARKIATFQGGQLNILRRFPKFGFVSPFHKEYAEINLGDLEKFIKAKRIDASKEITLETLKAAKIIKGESDGLKVLAKGAIASKMSIVAAKWSKAAEAAVVKAGGTIESK
ncbi:MAG: 50S ribosomal protein L15 [Rickettsiales bacterium]|jgi:large subunit ribosomal protein L15|nr:50S ribosomal protein L15 [Rickettsiales bacterium]